MKSKSIQIDLPLWLQRHLLTARDVYPTREDRMAFVIGLARQNIQNATGGPFAAAIFDGDTGKLLAAGVNMVTTLGLSIAHAEIIAITQAHALLGSFDLGGPQMPRCELVTSTAPCAMCLGAIPWSGVRTVVCGARDEDAREVGFDEGSKRDDWVRELEIRGIEVVRDVLRDEAAAVLRDYAEGGGVVYNGRSVDVC
jgi:tRNA(Arg) A34 adenosine deaminase TadA